MILATAPRSTSQATLITGLLGSGKTWSLTNQLLQAARTQDPVSDNYSKSRCHGGSLLALGGQDDFAVLRRKVDLERPLGCTKCDVITFPALVRTIVHDFGPTVGSYTPGDVRLLDRSSLAVFVHRNLDGLPLGKYRPLHTPGDAVKQLLHLFSCLAHCGVTPEDYLRYVETLEAELEQTPKDAPAHLEVGEGEEVEDVVAAPTRAQLRAQLEGQAWREHVAGERDKANSYEAFVGLKRREEVVDYSDHLLLARRILKESATARAALSLRLSHIYVDDLHEYSPAMMDVLAGLVVPGVGITATVDPIMSTTSAGVVDGHAIGAEHAAIARFKKAFPGTVELRLPGSRQRTDDIHAAMKALEACSAPVAVKTKNTEAVKRNLSFAASAVAETSAVAGNEELGTATAAVAAGSRLTCLTFETESDELKALGRRVRELIDRGVSPGEIGVAAVGGWGTADALIAALSAAGVFVEDGRRFSSVFDRETPRMLMSLLRCIVHPSESTPLLHLLMNCPAYALPGGELPAALEGHLSRYVPLRSFLRKSSLVDGVSMHSRGEDRVPTGAGKVAERLLADIHRFAEASRKKGVRELMLDFLRHTGQLERLEEPNTSEEEQEGRAVAALFEVVVMAEKQAGGENVALVEPILRLFRRHGVAHADFYRFEQEKTASEAGGSSGAVHVFKPCKYNAANDRSYHTVFIPFCSRSRLPGPLRTARLPVPGPFRGSNEPRDSERIRSETRLARFCHENRARAMMYAAVGSATQDVCFSVSARLNRGGSHLTPSPFLAEMLGADAPREWKTRASSKTGASTTDATARDVAPRTLVSTGRGRGDVGAARPLRLSFSSISSYASCPHSYYLQHVLNVSPPPSPRMVYGRAMHEAVAALLRVAIGGDGGVGSSSTPTLQAVVQDFHNHFDGCAFESAEQVRTLTANGVGGLESFLSRLAGSSAGVSLIGGEDRVGGVADVEARLLVERKFMVRIPEADVVLTGIFDRVDMVSKGVGDALRAPIVSITDYKSNVGNKDPARMVQDNLQLRLYSLAAERLFGVMPAELAIESIEDGRRGVTVPSLADAELALEATCVTAAAVRAEKFDATPSFQACYFCGFKHMCRHSSVTNAAL